MTITGLHHIGLICAEAPRTAGFYTEVLGLRAGAVGTGLAVSDGAGRTLLHFQVRPEDPEGRRGVGATHHVAFAVADGTALRKWKRRLTDRGLKVVGPYERRYFQSIYLRDPDGIILELATLGPGWTVDEPADRLGSAVQAPPDPHVVGRRDESAIAGDTWPEPVEQVTDDIALAGLHHVTAICSSIERTARFYQDLLGLQMLKKTYNFDNPKVPHWYLGPGAGQPGTVITYFGEGDIGTRPGSLGRGLTHHIAFAVAGQGALAALRDRLAAAGLSVADSSEEGYRAIRFADPDGHILEAVATGE